MKLIKMSILLLLFISYAHAKIKLTDIESQYLNITDIKTSEKLAQNFNFGFSNTTGNTNNLDVNAKYDLLSTITRKDGEIIKILFDTSLFFTKTNSKKSNEEYLVNLQLEQELEKQWLSYFTFNWLRNPEFKNYNHKTSVGAGVGKNIFFDGTRSVTIKIGTAYNKENYANQQTSQDFSSLNEYLEYKNQLNKISKLYFKTGLLQNFNNFSENYEALAILGVIFTVGEKINLSIEQELAYDNLPPVGFKKSDTKSIVRLGYKF